MKRKTTLPATRGRVTQNFAAALGGSPLALALKALRGVVAESAELRVDLPHGDTVRMRNLVHRGTQRPVFNVPSLKLDRAVQCESLLEYEATLLLDVAPVVSSFAEQPARIHYVLEGDWHSHIPDFAVMVGKLKAFVEIKFEKDVDDAVRERTARLQTSLSRVGWEYHLLTEVNLRRGSVVDNALAILRRARHATCEVRTLQTLERLRQGSECTLGKFGWSTHGHPEALSLAHLITAGHAAIDWSRPLTGSSPVWATKGTTNEESAQWLLALSA